MKRLMLPAAWLTVAVLLAAQTAASLAATPEPGGANQLKGVEGKVNQQVFNGQIRLKVTSLRNATAADSLGDPHDGKKWLIVQAICSNGLPSGPYIGDMNLTIVDADGIAVPGEDHNNKPAPQGPMPPGAGWRQMFAVEIPTDFVPTKLLITDPSTHNFKAFRINLTPADLPK